VVVLANPRKGKRRRRRARSVVVMANPRRRRRHLRRNARHIGRRRRRRNPMGGGVMMAVKNVVKVGLPAILAGGSFGLLDARLLADKSAPIRYGGKVAYALALGLLFRKNPLLAASTMGGVLGSFGSDLAAKLGGGTPAAPTTTAAVKGIGALLREDRQAMGVLIQELNGMGLSVDNDVSLQGFGRMGAVGVGDDTEQFNDVNLG